MASVQRTVVALHTMRRPHPRIPPPARHTEHTEGSNAPRRETTGSDGPRGRADAKSSTWTACVLPVHGVSAGAQRTLHVRRSNRARRARAVTRAAVCAALLHMSPGAEYHSP